jgi:serine/threonine protein kinase
VRNRTISRQVKALATANAEAVESSKTLLQRRRRAVAEPDRAGVRISDERISDERSPRREDLLLGRYRLLERLGAGGFGVVWRAHDVQLDRAVAVKRIPLPSEDDRERATREALATARLGHPAIVALYEASADEDAFYLISELVEGETLATLIGEDRLCDEDLLDIGLTLVGALEHAHARGVIHRDVKPQNVLIPRVAVERTPSRGAACASAKLADFGGARLAGDDALTRTGNVFGTLAYMAPEQSEGHEAGPQADLYSLALVLYEALSGVNPVRGLTPAATARRIGEPIPPLERYRRDLPRELTRSVDGALDPQPERRGTLTDLHDALAATLDRGLKRRRLSRRAPAAPRPSTHPSLHPSPHPSLHDPPRSPSRLDVEAHDADQDSSPRASIRPRITFPRLVWLGCLLALAAWQALQGRAGVSLLVLAAAAPLVALPRRAGPGWLAGALAPALGLAGLAGAFPALAGQRADWRARAALAALGFWWLSLAEPLLARRLWLGPPRGLPPRVVWEASFGKAAAHVLAATFTVELALGAAVWALASMVLPWIVRGRNATFDVGMAVVWTIALLATTPLLERALLSHASQPSARGALLGAVLGCAVAVCARALRGPV